MSNAFYQNIVPEPSFKHLINANKYYPLPEDWFVVATDIENSTQAIENGKYQDVNTIGASCIIAAINCNKDISIPFVFGGDGAFVAIPACMVDDIKKSLATLISMSQWQYNIKLRVGIFLASELYQMGLDLSVGKFQLSENKIQASISGSGWDYAEKAIKSNQTLSNLINPKDYPEPKIDLTGFECRWQNIKSRYKHKICILICGTDSSVANENLYSSIYENILSIYGDAKQHHPVNVEQLHFKKNPIKYLNEVKTKFPTKAGYYKNGFKALFKILLMTMIGAHLMKKKKQTKYVNWGDYKPDFVLNSDYQKFDGGLKMILDGSDEMHDKIQNYLESKQQSGELVYGVYLCDSALVTCHISSYQSNHIHFIDGSNGGYAMAAKMLKKNLSALKAQ